MFFFLSNRIFHWNFSGSKPISKEAAERVWRKARCQEEAGSSRLVEEKMKVRVLADMRGALIKVGLSQKWSLTSLTRPPSLSSSGSSNDQAKYGSPSGEEEENVDLHNKVNWWWWLFAYYHHHQELYVDKKSLPFSPFQGILCGRLHLRAGGVGGGGGRDLRDCLRQGPWRWFWNWNDFFCCRSARRRRRRCAKMSRRPAVRWETGHGEGISDFCKCFVLFLVVQGKKKGTSSWCRIIFVGLKSWNLFWSVFHLPLFPDLNLFFCCSFLCILTWGGQCGGQCHTVVGTSGVAREEESQPWDCRSLLD